MATQHNEKDDLLGTILFAGIVAAGAVILLGAAWKILGVMSWGG